ncbi:hypothetical protein COV58_03245 [Candidatus Roizmanbacteria bacterium CG11_big_fil_rev_8_21_14_0_20_36_8]|uniref:Methyltransferase type 11 domain-containing protein n=2 Tax=Candidatus Roizmaniibacteriota TaxID=1752723 RepID=A0A2M6ITS2_9BACT|nr:MAG: hypothetical protein COV58_03245 [Candidatus Roizmanbacteria bacterium CG11_big_fil_rev_8_21_14_0_20_36_8]PIZ64676.1 MAG: hypothetical protein COY14_04175 [Candidatus Roizmanbacteria bacterium CG_4_10_14_0_2_um_filter_36_9]
MKISGFKDTLDWYRKNIQSYTKGYYKYKKQQNEGEVYEFSKFLSKGAKVLDAGCAAGRDSKYLAEEGLNVVGIDLIQEFVDLARKHEPRAEFIQGSFLELPFQQNSFDGIWANASLLHFETVEEVEKSLAQFYKVIKNGGILHVKVKAQKGAEKFVIIKDKLSKHDRFFQLFTLEEIKKLVTKAGFEIIKLEQYDETKKFGKVGRKGLEWIWCLARKR